MEDSGISEVGPAGSILLFSHNALEILRTMELFSVSPIIIIAAESSLGETIMNWLYQSSIAHVVLTFQDCCIYC